ncbi:retrovirus-related pol polyprotein from transposon TNT 1-94 [Tanacetum coccineum]
MTTLADKSLLFGGDNKPPRLEKHLYDSWKSIMELYMINIPHGRMILASVEKGPLVWPSITEDGVTRLKEYVELTPAEAIQADCDIKAINIILQGLPTEIYALVSQHRVAKDLWELIKLLMQGTSLTKNKNESASLPIYLSPQPSIPQVEYAPTAYQQQQPEFSQPGISLRTSSNTCSNKLPFMWKSKYANLFRETNYLFFAWNNEKIYTWCSGCKRWKQRTVICYNCKGEGHIAKQCTKPKRKRDETWFNDKVLLVQAQASGQALTEEEIAFLADPGLPDIQTSQTVITHKLAFQDDDLGAMTLIVRTVLKPKIALMTNLYRNGSDSSLSTLIQII